VWRWRIKNYPHLTLYSFRDLLQREVSQDFYHRVITELTYDDYDDNNKDSNNKYTRVVPWLMPVHKKVTNPALLTQHVLSRKNSLLQILLLLQEFQTEYEIYVVPAENFVTNSCDIIFVLEKD